MHFLVALLSGARNEKNSQLAQDVFNQMKELFPTLPRSMLPASVLLANVYAASGDLDKASDIRSELHRTGMKKEPGLSSTAVLGKLCVSVETGYGVNELSACFVGIRRP